MNTLSWLIYMSSVLPSLSTFLAFTCLIAGFIFIIFFIIAIVSHIDGHDENISDLRARAVSKPLAKIAGAYLLVVGIITAMIPSQKTVLLIAASEVGEQVIKSKQFSDTLDPSMEFIQQWVKKQTSTILEDSKK